MINHCKLLKKYDINNLINYDSKYLLKNKLRLLITIDDNEIYRCNNIQTLYLYPLTIIDYINNITNKNIIFLNIIEIGIDLDYIKIFMDKKFSSLKAIEISIKSNYSSAHYKKIHEIIEIACAMRITISLNIKNINCICKFSKKTIGQISYFKIFLPTEFDEEYYNEFLNKLAFIKEASSSNSLIHIKTYLDFKQINFYEKMIKDFSKFNVDIFQVSKKLIEFGEKNIKVTKTIQKIIRKLELKYNNFDSCKFISVKDISCLYYPRFELDERNSKKCYACQMKPYLFKDKILPCKVNKVFLDLNEWSANYLDNNKYKSIINKCGICCDDCASIFENDLLNDIETIINSNDNNIRIFLERY